MTLADLVPPVGWADVVTKRDLDHGLADLEHRLDGQLHELDLRHTREINELRADLHRLLGEQTRLVAEQTRVLVFTSLGSMVGFGSLVLGAVAIAG